jgi:hypothetical protein
MFNDINMPYSNVSTHIKNFCPVILYGINSGNELFQVIPEDELIMTGTIYVMSQERVPNQLIPNIFCKRYYRCPTDNLPLYIEEMGCVLFINDKERMDAITKYGTGRKLVQAYAAGIIPLVNASYIAITCLSQKTYYQVQGEAIEEIPGETEEYINRMMLEYGISREKMETHDVFIINTHIRKGIDNKLAKDMITKTKVEYVEKATIKPGNPIIFSYNGLVIFNEYKDAQNFLQQYGNIENYMITLSLAVTRHKQEKQIEELNKRASSDKRNMIQVFSLMGGTSVCSIFAETLIKCAKEGTDGSETLKRLLKILGIGVLGVGGILGIYILFKKYTQYKEENKKKRA